MTYANNTALDEPAHLHSLAGGFGKLLFAFISSRLSLNFIEKSKKWLNSSIFVVNP